MSVVKLNMFLILKLVFSKIHYNLYYSSMKYSRYRTEYAVMQLDKLI